MSGFGFVIEHTPGVAGQHDVDGFRIFRRSHTRRDFPVAQPTRDAGQRPQMHRVVAIWAQEQECEIGGHIVRGAEVLGGLEAREHAHGLVQSGNGSVRPNPKIEDSPRTRTACRTMSWSREASAAARRVISSTAWRTSRVRRHGITRSGVIREAIRVGAIIDAGPDLGPPHVCRNGTWTINPGGAMPPRA